MLLDDNNQPLIGAYELSGVGQAVTMTGAHQESAVMTAKHVVVFSTAVFCYIAIGLAPVATTSSIAIPPNVWVPLYVGVGNKISGLGASGILIIDELKN